MNALVKLNGDSGNLNGSKIIKKLVCEHVLSEDFLCSCTWTGKTNVKNVRKIELRKYKSLMKLIYETVLAADKTYTLLEFQTDMVKKVLKYAYANEQKDTAV